MLRATAIACVATAATADSFHWNWDDDANDKDVVLPRGMIFEGNSTDMQIAFDHCDQLVKEFAEESPSNTYIQRSVAHCSQYCDQWCWATSATMCASAHGGGSNCNSNEGKVVSKAVGRSCSTSSCKDNKCNRGGMDSEIAAGIRLLSGHSYTTGHALSRSALDSALKHGPVTLHISWSGGGGHAIMVESVSGGKYRGFDPWPPQKGTSISASYDGLAHYKPKYGGSAKWTSTIYTTSSSSIAV